jgi:hypothetical protein
MVEAETFESRSESPDEPPADPRFALRKARVASASPLSDR